MTASTGSKLHADPILVDPDVIALKGGDWACLWQTATDGTGRAGNEIYYADSSGHETTTLIQPNEQVSHIEFKSAARNRDGNIYILYTAKDNETGEVGLYSRIFDEDLKPITKKPTLIDNDLKQDSADAQASVIALSDGSFAPVWMQASTTLGQSIMQIQDGDGDVIRGPLPLADYSPSDFDIVALDNNRFACVRQDDQDVFYAVYELSKKKDVYGMRDVDSVMFDEAVSSSMQALGQRDVEICSRADGGFVITYESFFPGQEMSQIFQRAFDADGKPISLGLLKSNSEIQVHTDRRYYQTDANTAGLEDGGWATVWREGTDDPNSKQHDIFLKIYNEAGFGATVDIQVNTETGNCIAPEVTALANGNVLVSWTQHGTVQQRVITLPGNEIYGTNESADRISGTSDRDKIYGLEGHDTILAYRGRFYDKDGSDLIDGGAGNDVMYGGVGDDIYVIDTTDDGVFEMKHEGNDTIRSTFSLALYEYQNVENVKLMDAMDLRAYGSVSNNRMIGNSGDNKLFGLDGDDVLEGRRGSDHLTGGAGQDIFVFRAGDGEDRILDFDIDQDTIDLSAFTKTGSVENLTFKEISGGNILIDLGSGDEIILENVKPSELADHQFLFAA
jgi:Ca2+-binding RTX toxin-like protein